MGFFDFFKRKTEQDRQTYKKAVNNLDFDVAITAHQNWKIRLGAYLSGHSQENFSPDIVACDDKCDLGKWLYGDGQIALGEEMLFQDLKAMHKVFHYTASNVVTLHQTNRHYEAKDLLEGNFSKQSKKMVQRLNDFKELL